MKITPLYRYNTSCDYHRIILPFKYLGYNVEVQDSLEGSELVVFNRLPLTHIDNFLEDKRRIGFKYIVDVDDYWFLSPKHYLYDSFINNKIPEQQIKTIENADAVITTTNTLADKITPLNKNVYIIPNSLPFGSDQFVLNAKRNDKDYRFIYAGGDSHLEDVKIIKNVVGEFNFTLAGYSGSEQSNLIRNELPNNIELIGNRKLDDYMSVYEGFNTSLVPLVNDEFNECKSELKIIEAGCKGLAVIASLTLPYYNYRDYKYIDFADNEYEWYRLMNYHVKNPNYVMDKSMELAEYVRSRYHMKDTNEFRENLFKFVHEK